MRGNEHIQATDLGRGAETVGFPIESPEVQEALMLLAYRDALKKKGDAVGSSEILLADPEKNALEVQAAAGANWVESLPDRGSLAAAFRAYAETHPYKRVHVGDEGELEELIAELGAADKKNIS
ncbi:MAG: hypothetical protein ACHQU0_02445 [Candidatus Paceibacteria bacterium]